MKFRTSILFLFFLPYFFNAQTFNPFYADLADEVKKINLEDRLTEFTNFGVKEMGTTAQQQTLDWLINYYQDLGYDDIEQHQISVWGETGYNLIVTKTGTLYPDTYIIIDGHYDTIYGPGSNDNGSGTVIIMEIARILKDIPTEYSIKFIHFTGEELGLHGSYQYVEDVVIPQNLDIKLVFNIDQVGGTAGKVNDTIICERDESPPYHNNTESAIVTDELAVNMEHYSNLYTTQYFAYGSDYVPFQEEGFVITGLYEYQDYPYTHSPQDTMDKIDMEYIYQVAKGSLGALCYFSKAYENLSVNEMNENDIQVYPNPVRGILNIKTPKAGDYTIQLTDLNGKTVLTKHLKGIENQINTFDIPAGIYWLTLSTGEFTTNKRIIITKD